MTCNYCSKSRKPEDKPNPYPEGTLGHAFEDAAQAFRKLGAAILDEFDRRLGRGR
jgi:hypothetical protein